MFGSAFIVCFWTSCGSIEAINTFCFFYAFLVFGFYSLLPSTVALYFDVGEMGSVVGNIFVAFVPGSFSPILAGYCYDRMGSYLVAQIYVPACLCICGAILMTMSKPPAEAKGGGKEATSSCKTG
jgi:hypothetical protein